jgi:hypothetical protein
MASTTWEVASQASNDSTAAEFLERTAIEICQQSRDREVQLPQREAQSVAKPCEGSSLHDKYAHRDRGLSFA